MMKWNNYHVTKRTIIIITRTKILITPAIPREHAVAT